VPLPTNLKKPEADLLAELAPAIAAGRLRIERDASPYWEWLNSAFPTCGNTIDLKATKWAVSYPDWKRRFETPRALWTHVLSEPQMQGVEELIVVDDGKVDFAVLGSVEVITGCFDAFYEHMLHRYFCAPGHRLCFCVRWEGDAFLCGV